VEGYCRRGNEPSGSIRFWEIEELGGWRLLKNNSAL
jgi:hypothetical protein